MSLPPIETGLYLRQENASRDGLLNVNTGVFRPKPVPPKQTIFGYNTNENVLGPTSNPPRPSGTRDAALSDRLAMFNGRAPMVRRYTGSMLPATFNLNTATCPEKRVSYSFKPDATYTPAALASGSGNARIKSWVESIPAGWTVYLTYLHEVNDDIREGAITAGQFTGAYDQFYPVIKAATLQPGVTVRLCANYMAYLLTNAAYFQDTWVPGHDSMDLLTFDIYGNPGHFTTGGTRYDASFPVPATRCRDMFAVIDRLGWGDAWGILELNSPERNFDGPLNPDYQVRDPTMYQGAAGQTGPLRAAWTRGMIDVMLARPTPPEVILMWEAYTGVNWDQHFYSTPVIDVWREFITGTPVGGV